MNSSVRFALCHVAVLAALLVGASIGASPARAAEPFIEKADLFTAGCGGYKVYHIPGIAVTARGTVLAWCEARRQGGDWDSIDLLLRRSTDDGKSWSEPTCFPEVPGPKAKNPVSLKLKSVRPGDVTYNNPVLIPDRNGSVHALFCLEYMRCFHCLSADDGLTWSAPEEITAAFDKFRPAYDWRVLATGPDHGVQLTSGRLIVPVWMSTGTGGNAHRPSVAATIYSDDHGATWRAGEIAVPCTDEWINPNETTALELADGSVMLNVRSESKANRRLVTVSKDGASGWSTPRFDDALPEPICMASLVRLSMRPPSDKSRVLFCNPDNLTRQDHKEAPGNNRDRKNLSVRLSYDEGKTWAVTKSIEPGWSAYSDLAVTPAGTLLCFYGRSGKPDFAGDRLTLARFNLEWLTDNKDALPPAAAPENAAPASAFDLLHWKLQIPGPKEIKDLKAYSSPYFHLDAMRDMCFHLDAAEKGTTTHAHFVRSELRHVPNWPVTETHTLTAEVRAISHLEPDKVTVLQIHGITDTGADAPPLLRIALNGGDLVAIIKTNPEGTKNDTVVLKKGLGSESAKVEVAVKSSQLTIRVNGEEKVSRDLAFWKFLNYFKAGCYPQSKSGTADVMFRTLTAG